MPTFGNTHQGTSGSTIAGNRKWAGMFELLERGRITKLSVYQKLSTLSGFIRGVIYSYKDGYPDMLIATTQESKTTSGAAWLNLPFIDTVILEPGYYFIGVIVEKTTWNYHDSGIGQTKFNADTYSDGPTNPFGDIGSSYDWNSSIYATYEVPRPPILVIGIINIR